jgi:hypothetical protein
VCAGLLTVILIGLEKLIFRTVERRAVLTWRTPS